MAARGVDVVGRRGVLRRRDLAGEQTVRLVVPGGDLRAKTALVVGEEVLAAVGVQVGPDDWGLPGISLFADHQRGVSDGRGLGAEVVGDAEQARAMPMLEQRRDRRSPSRARAPGGHLGMGPRSGAGEHRSDGDAYRAGAR
jgi:hypothetical protein